MPPTGIAERSVTSLVIIRSSVATGGGNRWVGVLRSRSGVVAGRRLGRRTDGVQALLQLQAVERAHRQAHEDRDPVVQQPQRVGEGIAPLDRKSVVEGKSVSVRVDLGGRRIIKKKNRDTHIHNEES